MSVKDDTKNSLREHNGKMSQTSLIPITVSVDIQDKCKNRPRPIEVKKTTLNGILVTFAPILLLRKEF